MGVRLGLLAIMGFFVVAANGDDSFDLSSIVRHPDVKWSLVSIGVTRQIEELSSEHFGSVKSYESHLREYGSDYSRLEVKDNWRFSDFTTCSDTGWDVSGGLAWGFIPYGSIGGYREESTQSNDYKHTHNGTDVIRKNRLVYTEKTGSEIVTEDKRKLRFGKFVLKLVLLFQGQTPGREFRIGGGSSGVVVKGLGERIVVPFTKTYTLGCGELVCPLEMVINDIEAMRLLSKEIDWSAVRVEITSSQLPVISQDTGKNILNEMESAERDCPSMEFSLAVSDRKLSGLSPWRVEKTFPRIGDEDVRDVCLADALEAMNATLAKDRRLPKTIFKKNEAGEWSGVHKARLGVLREVNGELLATAVCLEGSIPEVSMLPFPAEKLKTSLEDLSSVRVYELNVKGTAENLYGPPVLSHVDSKSSMRMVTATKAAFEELARYLAERGDNRVADAIKEAGERLEKEKRIREEESKKAVCVAGITLVRIPGKSYLIGQTEVTQRQWYDVMGTNPSKFTETEDRPVECVSRDDVQAFLNKLNEREDVRNSNLRFRLPNQDEWAFACRAGSSSKWGWVKEKEAGDCDDMAWYERNSLGTTHPVKSKRSNAWGIYDMHGNVCEWTNDSMGGEFLLCGGSYADKRERCAADCIVSLPGNKRSIDVGFRVLAVED